MKVGDRVFVVEFNGRNEHYSDVIKMGRKYFYLKGKHPSTRFYISTMKQVTDCGHNCYSLYESEEAYRDIQDYSALRSLLRDSLGSFSSMTFTLSQLKEAVKALGIEDKKS